ncbi:hypothetical protein MUY27_19885 [Mucilaginibacter sp. RS28]|uniref:Quercetin 2,3-dioxygenase C-terminal cupin domain-containing protein n=1 Tax=Mucilaginibacter straminoryzae TaxID=2932774 RepID=A0A9X1X6M1_9SPHI|nr:hypothetical protein [Mucilaginibacter straminoryzae]MCJ8211989.1 hypothetical protein [Mucilaginibacter straminoryzae]
MKLTIPGKYYTADQRGLLQSNVLQQHCVFNYGNYYHEEREARGLLTAFNDCTLAAGKKAMIGGNKASRIILIPVTGSLMFQNGGQGTVMVEVGQILIDDLTEGGYFELSNPYADHWINFFQIEIDRSGNSIGPAVLAFDLDRQPGSLIHVTDEHPDTPEIFIGRFNGRQEAIHYMKGKNNSFACVVSGAFELQGRLLHQRDCLALWDEQEIEMEALSNNAVILFLTF